jgi:hypothetical protein
MEGCSVKPLRFEALHTIVALLTGGATMAPSHVQRLGGAPPGSVNRKSTRTLVALVAPEHRQGWPTSYPITPSRIIVATLALWEWLEPTLTTEDRFAFCERMMELWAQQAASEERRHHGGMRSGVDEAATCTHPLSHRQIDDPDPGRTTGPQKCLICQAVITSRTVGQLIDPCTHVGSNRRVIGYGPADRPVIACYECEPCGHPEVIHIRAEAPDAYTSAYCVTCKVRIEP